MENFAPAFFGNVFLDPFDPHPRDLWLQQRLDHKRLCEENFYNHGIRIHEEYLAHASEVQRLNRIADMRQRLLAAYPRALDYITYDSISLSDFPPLVQHMAKFVEQQTHLDITGIVLNILALTAVSCCGKVIIPITKDYSQPFILQLLSMSPSGTRKSEIKRLLCNPICSWTQFFNKDINKAIKKISEKESLAKRYLHKMEDQAISQFIKDSGGIITPNDIDQFKKYIDAQVESKQELLKQYEQKIERTVIIDSITPARFIKAVDENGESITLVSAEGDVLSEFTKNGSERFVNLVMRGYDHETFIYQKYNKNYTITRPAVSMMILTQPKYALKFYNNPSITEKGLTERIIPWYFSQYIFGSSFDQFGEIRSDICQKYEEKIKSFLNYFYTQDKNAPLCEINIESSLIDQVKQYLKRMEENAVNKNYGRAWFAKAGARTIRLACAIHMWNSDRPWENPINADELNLAAKLVDLISYHADFMYSPRGLVSIKPAEKILAVINRIEYPERATILREGISSTELQSRTDLSKAIVMNALDLLAQSNYIALLDEGKRNVTVIIRE